MSDTEFPSRFLGVKITTDQTGILVNTQLIGVNFIGAVTMCALIVTTSSNIIKITLRLMSYIMNGRVVFIILD